MHCVFFFPAYTLLIILDIFLTFFLFGVSFLKDVSTQWKKLACVIKKSSLESLLIWQINKSNAFNLMYGFFCIYNLSVIFFILLFTVNKNGN